MRVNVNTSKKNTKDEPKKLTFKSYLKTLTKNDAVVEAKDAPWYIAALFFFLSVILSFIPPVVNAATEKGSFILTNATYQMDVGLEAFSKTLYDNNIEFEVTSVNVDVDGKETTDANEIYDIENRLKLKTISQWENATKTIQDSTGKTIRYYQFDNAEGVAKFRVFYIEGDYDINGYSEAYNFFTTNSVFGISTAAEPTDKNLAPASMMVLGTHEIFIAIYAPNTTNYGDFVGNTYRGDYSRMDTSSGPIALHTLRLNADATNEEIQATAAFNNDDFATYITDSRWVGFLNEAYSVTRMNNTLMMFSLIGGINAIIILVFGFTLWILTRGKNNPHRTIKVSETLKMSCIASLSPAILSLIFGFIMPSFATLSFMLFASFRLMWLSMKTLRPSYN